VLIASLGELRPQPRRTVIINVNTDLVATRALLSAIEVVRDPVLFVNCNPTEAGRRHFEQLQARYEFDLLEAPTRLHGEALDWLFRETQDEILLLLDSDAEVRKPEFVERMRRHLENDLAFGAGFTWGPFFVSPDWLAPADRILYMERPWVPCVWLKTEPVREALAAGRTFVARFVPNDVAVSPRVSRFLAARWGPPWGPQSRSFDRLPAGVRQRMADLDLEFLKFARRRYHGLQPSMAVYDTAGDVYEYLKFDRSLLFAGIPVELMDGEVHHYSGVTRFAMHGRSALDTDPDTIAGELREQMRDRYGFEEAER